jgi:hypothetical protein
MNETERQEPMMQGPTPAEARRAVEQARSLFRRTLSVWVCDLLALRRAGLDTPGWATAPPGFQWSRAA